MTLDQALLLRKGDIVTSKFTMPSFEPNRIAEVWISDNRQHVMIRIPKLGKERWLHAIGFELPEDGKVWCTAHKQPRWEWSADHRRDHPEYYRNASKSSRKRPAERGAR